MSDKLQCEHPKVIKSGGSEDVQRYKCRSCGKTFSTVKMNRLPESIRQVALQMLNAGVSGRSVSRILSIHKLTAAKLQQELGLPKPAKRPDYHYRDRAAYCREYESRQELNSYQRLQQNDKIRATAALWLAKNPAPLSLEQIFTALKVQFPTLKKVTLSQMLNRDVEHCFKRVGNRFTYHPSPVWIPVLNHGKPSQRPEVAIARAIWFDRHGLKDELTDYCINSLLREHENHTRARINRAIESIQPSLQLAAAAAAIQDHESRP